MTSHQEPIRVKIVHPALNDPRTYGLVDIYPKDENQPSEADAIKAILDELAGVVGIDRAERGTLSISMIRPNLKRVLITSAPE
jgi:hypothetical protein